MSIIIFSDAATSPQTGISVGAFLCLDQQSIANYSEYSYTDLTAKLSELIVYKKYKSKKSTWSEIKTVIDALHLIQKDTNPGQIIEIYSDCQSLCDLLGRRKEKLKNSNFITQSGKVLQNADLYKELFNLAEYFQIKTIKIKGHERSEHRLTIHEKIFDILDKLSRKELRSILNCTKDK